MIVLLPVCGGGQHDGVQRLDEVGALFLGDKLLLHHAQGEQGLTQAVGQGRADLEDGDAVGDHVVQVGGGLVVGGVALEADVRELLQGCAEVHSGGRVIVEHLLVAELDAGLDDHSDDVLHAVAHALFGPDALVSGNGVAESIGAGDSQRVLSLGSTAGDGYFAADDEDGTHCIGLLGLQLFVALHSCLVQLSAAACDDLGLEQAGSVVSHLHAGVEVDLGKACAGILVDQLDRVLHGLGLGQLLPGQGAEVVACQDHHVLGQVDVFGHFQDHLVEVGRLHAGVAAKLVDLVGGGFDQDGDAALLGAAQRDLNDQLVGAAIRGDAAADALAALIHHFLKRVFHVCYLLRVCLGVKVWAGPCSRSAGRRSYPPAPRGRRPCPPGWSPCGRPDAGTWPG